MKPTLSIIIPCFNSEKTIEEAVHSCFQQNLNENFEIVIVDDGSTDATKEIIRNLAEKHSEIKYFLLEKNGVLCPLYSTFMHTKKAFETVGGYPTEHGFDTQGFAWRFLAAGFTAYTCPDTSYYHRINYKLSYYLRETEQGKVNYNWKD